MNSVLFGNGYWGGIVKEKVAGLTNLLAVVDSKTSIAFLNNRADVVFVCSPTPSHYGIVKNCINSDIKYIYCTKPFTGNYEQAKELYNLAKRKSVNIFVDNLFLYREEIVNYQLQDFRNIAFYWDNPHIKEGFFNSLLYHDLYLLQKFTQYNNWKVNSCRTRDNALYLSMINDFYQTSYFEYYINESKCKRIVIDGHVIDLTHPGNDPLKECIVAIIEDKMDYESNKKTTLDTLKLMDSIKSQL